MNAREIMDIEDRLTPGSYTLPISQELLDSVVRHAKRQRALYVGRMLASIPRAIVRLVTGVRATAASCTESRLSHS